MNWQLINEFTIVSYAGNLHSNLNGDSDGRD